MQVYGADTVWRQLAREGMAVGRYAVERLMKYQGLRGVVRGKIDRLVRPRTSTSCFSKARSSFLQKMLED